MKSGKVCLLAALFLARIAGAEPALTVESVQCEGNARIPCDQIRADSGLHPGQALEAETLADVKLKLALRREFSDIVVEVKRTAVRGRVDVVIRVKEESPYFSEWTAAYTLIQPRSTVLVEPKFGTRDLFGTGKTLQGSIRVQKELSGDSLERYFGRLDYFDPRLFGSRKFFLNGSVFGGTFWQPTLAPNFNADRMFGGSVGLGYRLSDASALSLGAFGALARFRDENGPFGTATFGLGYLGYSYETEDHPYMPRRGSRFFARVGVSKLQNFTLGNLYIDLGYRTHFALSEKLTLSLNLLGDRASGLETRFAPLGLETEQMLLSLGLGYDLRRNAGSGLIRSARLTVAPGVAAAGDSAAISAALKTGLNLDVEGFGAVNFFFVWGAHAR